jgi:RNA-directed DNA polymerase
MSRQKQDAQPAVQAGDRKAGRVEGEVGVLRSSVDLWESITHEERREGTYPHAAKRSKGRGDGSQELPAPTKVRELQIALYRKAKAEPQYRFWSLYGEVQRKDVLAAAFAAVRRNDGAPGVDGQTLASIVEGEGGKEKWLEELRAELKEKRYRPAPVLRVWIEKKSGGERPLGIPTVKDRVVQMAVYLVLMPIFEARFHARSFGFRPKRRAHQAMDAISEGIRSGRVEVLDADISKCFDCIPHQGLMRAVAKRVSDGAVLALIRGWLRAPVVEGGGKGGQIRVSKMGTPQGGVLSPLLCNVYLDPLDQEINEGNLKRFQMVRYADDFVVLAPAGKGAQARELVEEWMVKAGLALNQEKTKLVNILREGIRFLGFGVKMRRSMRGRNYVHTEPTPQSCASLRDKVREILNHNTEWKPIAEVVQATNAVVRGWSGYFHYGNSVAVFGKMRHWVSNRLRRWLWRKHACRCNLHREYSNENLYDTYGLWCLPLQAAWVKS